MRAPERRERVAEAVRSRGEGGDPSICSSSTLGTLVSCQLSLVSGCTAPTPSPKRHDAASGAETARAQLVAPKGSVAWREVLTAVVDEAGDARGHAPLRTHAAAGADDQSISGVR